MKITLKMTGCKNNRYELTRIQEWAEKNGVPIVDETEADFGVINTCTVTHIADRKTRQMIRSTKKLNPRLKIIAFGCGVRMQKEAFGKIADIVLPDLPAVLGFLENERGARVRQPEDAIRQSRLRVVSMSIPTRARALTQIQDGCDNFCTYCIIARARGRSKNREAKDIIDEIEEHEKNGYKEVMITGINIGAYGASSTLKPDESRLAELLEEILEKTTIPRIRLSSMGPQYFSEKLYKILKNPRFCRHIHFSIQSGSDSVLKRMRRPYTVQEVESVVQRLRNDIHGIAITTDIIVGFPEETEEEFCETMDFVKQNKLAKVHAFPYSIRQNTLAAKMKQVSETLKKRRAHELQEAADELRKQFIQSQIGQKCSVLWRKEVEPGVMEGLTDNYIRVVKKGPMPRRSVTEEILMNENVIWD